MKATAKNFNNGRILIKTKIRFLSPEFVSIRIALSMETAQERHSSKRNIMTLTTGHDDVVNSMQGHYNGSTNYCCLVTITSVECE